MEGGVCPPMGMLKLLLVDEKNQVKLHRTPDGMCDTHVKMQAFKGKISLCTLST